MNKESAVSLPGKIFRYRPVTPQTIDALRKNKLYLSLPFYFNDPFDSLSYVNEEQFQLSIYHQLKENMGSYLAKIHSGPLSKSSDKEKIIRAVDDPELMGPFLEEVIRKVDDAKKRLRENVGVICFSEDHLSTLMWAHYSDSHGGFVLEYDTKRLMECLYYNKKDRPIKGVEVRLEKVNYTEKRFDLGEYLFYYLAEHHKSLVAPKVRAEQKYKPPIDQLVQMLLTKSKEWEYEKEWRLIPSDFDILTPFQGKYIKAKPSAIYLGAKISQENSTVIRNIAEKKHVPVYCVSMEERNQKSKLTVQKDL